ncbi:hypothetical protein FXN63_24545 [Pigmentiphaga aceris]|uniref:Calcium-binding protein n=1 Tax=Pigmentiphaga aceris TaxID=1940612 RepID=A0A5C0B5Q4_9BURK|nr:hypothetical protein [Pigmentiphaga aceris]QEI08660.1 hypothetical protein FXN63_24545 [Pigmentiphaga aceris]
MLTLTSFTAANGGVKLISSNATAGVLNVITGEGVDVITAVGASIDTLNVGGGNDVVTLISSGLSAGASIDLGAGNDTLVVTVPFVAGGTINGGAGRDTLQISDVTPNYAAINSVISFEVLALAASGALVDVGQITNTTLSSFAVANTGTTSFINAKLGSAFSIDTSVNVAAVNIESANGVANVDITLNNNGLQYGPPSALAALSVTGASTISLTSAGSGAQANIITALSTSSSTTVSIDGNVNLTLSLAAGVGSTINATGFTGRLNLTASDTAAVLIGGRSADTIVGSSGNDTIVGGTASGNNIADILTGGAGNDNFKFLTLAETRNNDLLNSLRTDAALMDRITDFNGNGAGIGDTITFGIGANAFGVGLTFTSGTTAVVTAVAVSNATDIRSLNEKIWAEVGATAIASTNAVAQVYDVTVTGGLLAGRYLVMDNGDRIVNVADTMISLTGMTGALHASDILFAA